MITEGRQSGFTATTAQKAPTLRTGRRARRGRQGAALITTLVAVAVSSVMAAGIATLVLGHHTRARTDQDAAKALDMAENGLNFQVQRIFSTLNVAQAQYNGSNLESTSTTSGATFALRALPFPVTEKRYNGTTSTLNDAAHLGLNVAGAGDYCRAWIEYPTNATRALDLTSTDVLYVYGEARVNGVMRRVRAKAGADGLFDRWAVFANGGINIGGSFSVSPVATAPVDGKVGMVGSNGTIVVDKDVDAVGGQVVYGTGVPDSGFPYSYGGQAVELPTIDDLAAAEYLENRYSASNSNSGVAKFSTVNDNAAFGTITKGSNNTNPLPTNGAVQSADYPIRLRGKAGTANFFLTRLDGSNVRILADVSTGPVNLWVSNTNTGTSGNNSASDQISGTVQIVAYKELNADGTPRLLLDNSKLFRVYYSNQHGSLRFVGGGDIYAMFYAYNTFNGVPRGTFEVVGSTVINGAAYVQNITGSGNFTVNYPTKTGLGDDAGLLFGLRTPWQEHSPVRAN